MEKSRTEKGNSIAELILSSKYTVILTGAGMSTESGIPDFRTPMKGLYDARDFFKFAQQEAIVKRPKEFTDFFRGLLKEFDNYSPNNGHEILAKWEEHGLVKSIITQNVDEFHQMAGSKNVIEMHGSIRKIYCNDCGRKFTLDEYIIGDETTCKCGGVIRPSIVLFDELVKDLYSVNNEIQKAELLIVLGTSLRVYPAAELPERAHSNGAKVVIINKEPTGLDYLADIVVNDRLIGEVLREIDEEIGGQGRYQK